MTLEVHTVSEPGDRPANEDAYLFQPHPAGGNVWLCCLADGQGGRPGGARAAQVACQHAILAAGRTPVATLVAGGGWTDALYAADNAVAADAAAGFTTLVGFCIVRDRIVGASCGDSAVVLMDPAGTAVLTNRQVKNPPVGSGAVAVTPFTARLGDGWRVVAMTDGVWKYVGWERVIAVVRSHAGRAALDALLAAARLPGSGGLQDDFTAVLVASPAAGGPPHGRAALAPEHCS